MYVVVVGCGRTGYHLVSSLLEQDHEVLVIERDPDQARWVSERLGSVVLEGDGSDPAVLAEAGVERADVFIAATDRDEVNLAACQFARTLFSVPKTIAVVHEAENDTLFREMEVDAVVAVPQMVLSAVEGELGRRWVHLANLTSEVELVSVDIVSDAKVVGARVTEVDLPPNSSILLVAREDQVFRPTPDVVLRAGDQVLVLTSPDEEAQVFDVLTEVE